MTRMDVTPQELRGSEIKEAWRGYHRDEVDELLERAAVTIEHLNQQLASASARPAAEAPAPAPASYAPSRDDAEVLQRTLVLAQRAADEAVSDAQAEARRLVDDAETRAQALVGEAEASARRIAESERRRLEADIQDLVSRRDALLVDADAIEDYARAYRERVRAAIESDLHRLGNGAIAPPKPRPELSALDAPLPAAEPDRPSVEVYDAFGEEEPDTGGGGYDTRSIVVDGPGAASAEPASSPVAAPPRPETEWPPPASQPSAGDDQRSAPNAYAEPAWLAGKDIADNGLPRAELSSWDNATAVHQPFSSDTPMEATAVDSDSLDDDAFFASLRDAVRDDERVGPQGEEPVPFFDDDLADDRRRFRRRR
jgi:DivIVA domain-containing protein